MRIHLISIETYGMKNMKNNLSFHFSNSTIGKYYDNSDSRVKAIFGENGAGKSAFIGAVDLYKKLIFQYAFLANSINQKIWSNLINKERKEFQIRMIFVICRDDDFVEDTYAHTIHISNINGTPYIDFERIEKLNGKTINSEWKEILRIEDGKLIVYYKNNNEKAEKLNDYLERGLNSLGGLSSAASVLTNESYYNQIINMIPKEKYHEDLKDTSHVLNAIMGINIFGGILEICMQNQDSHNPFSNKDFLRLMRHFGQCEDNKKESFFDNLLVNEEMISKKRISQYRKEIEKLNSFIQIFKPELQNIKILSKVDGTQYHVSKEFCYDQYSINEEFESAGIKRLTQLFSFFKQAVNGKIVFIDEVDVNINEIVFNKLLSYLVNNIKGQLIFTTHNTSCMKIVKHEKNGIDFLTEKNRISWKSNGHYSPNSQYENGMIPGIPFNIDEFDFYKCFEGE